MSVRRCLSVFGIQTLYKEKDYCNKNMFQYILPTEQSGQDFHHFFPTEPSGMRTCPQCKTGISGPQSSGKCRDLQQRSTPGQKKANQKHPGRNPNCDYVFLKPVAKKDKRNDKLQKRNDELQKRNEELSALNKTPTRLHGELKALQDEVDVLKRQNAYMRDELDTLQPLSDSDDTFDDIFSTAPPLSRGNSLAPLDRNSSLDGMVHMGDDELFDGIFDEDTKDDQRQEKQENVQLRQQLDTVRQTLQQLLQQIP